MTKNGKDVRLLIRRSDLPGGLTRKGEWRDPVAAYAELTRLFWAFVGAFPGAAVEVTSHPRETVLYVGEGFDMRKAGHLCEHYLPPHSRPSPPPVAPQSNARGRAAAKGTEG